MIKIEFEQKALHALNCVQLVTTLGGNKKNIYPLKEIQTTNTATNTHKHN